jgi:hypothetical protein
MSPLCALGDNTNMAPNTFIPDLNESSSRGTSFNDGATCGASRQSPKAKRSITFSPFATIHNVLHINDYSDEEIACAWYDADELETIKKMDVIYTLSMMKSGLRIPVDSPWYCGRGLESFTQEGSTIRRSNKEKAWDAVLDEQDSQRENGICDPQAIANAYSELSRDCQDVAVRKAIQQDKGMSHAASIKLKGGASPFYRRLVGDDCRREVSSKAA